MAVTTSDDRVTVLLADDTPGIRLLLRLALEADGRFIVVDEAADGAQAIELAAVHHPQVILLDMSMPVMDGLQALPGLRQQSPESRVIVLTAFSAERLEAETLALGASAYLEKGLDPRQICEMVLRIARATVPQNQTATA